MIQSEEIGKGAVLPEEVSVGGIVERDFRVAGEQHQSPGHLFAECVPACGIGFGSKHNLDCFEIVKLNFWFLEFVKIVSTFESLEQIY
jgi:hypothetical protein